MKKWVILLVVFFSLVFTGLEFLFNESTYHYMITVAFSLVTLITYSLIALQSYRTGVILKDVKYLYFFFMSFLMAAILFGITIKNLTFSTFDNYYFSQVKFLQIVLFFIAIFLTRNEKRTKVFSFITIVVMSLNIYMAFQFFRMELMNYLPIVFYIELIIMFELFINKNIKKIFQEIVVYNILSEVVFIFYQNSNNNVFFYLGSLSLFALGAFRISSHFNSMHNRDYYRKQYVKEKKAQKLLNINEKAIMVLQGFNIKKANKAALNLLGLKNIGEVRGRNLFNFISTKDFGETNFENRIDEGEKKVWIKLANGIPHKMLVNISRISGTKESEYVLEFKEEVSFGDLFYKLNDELDNVVYIYEEEEGYKYVSKGIAKLLHYNPEEFYADKWFTRKISVDNKFEKILKNKEEQCSFMARYKTKEGDIVYLKENVKKINIGDKSIYYGIVTEVTEFIYEIEELNAIKKDLEEKNNKKDMSMSIVSHEIRTPITAIIGFLENIIINNRNIEKTIDSMIKKAYSNSIRLKELVNNLLDLNKLNAGKLDLYKESNDLKALVEEVLLNNETLIDIKKITCKNEMQEKVDVSADSAMLYQIVNNIVSNSIKYNKEGGELSVSITDEANSVILNIKDTGIGIPEENKEKVFLEYERIRGSKEKGTGLGLPLAKRLIELNDGEIWFDSQAERGTIFRLRFKKV